MHTLEDSCLFLCLLPNAFGQRADALTFLYGGREGRLISNIIVQLFKHRIFLHLILLICLIVVRFGTQVVAALAAGGSLEEVVVPFWSEL